VITGNVVEEEGKKPIEAAQVELLQLPDSVATESVFTNSEGSFNLFKADTTKNYCVRVKLRFYKMQIVPVIFKPGGRILSLGNIELQPSSVNLKEITVNGSKIKVSELPDRTVYGISADMKKTSTDGLDVLRKVPTVQVDYFNEDIKVEGKSNIKIEVDGISRDKSYLKKLHPSQIEKMEVITSPTGKYDADVDAVINVITIKEMRYGLKGMVNAMLLPNDWDKYMARGNASLDYGMKKISYSLSANGGAGEFDFINSMTRTAGTSGLQRNGNTHSKFTNGNVNAGFIYDPDDFNNLSVNLSYNGSGSTSKNDQTNNISDNNVPQSINKTISNSENKNSGLNTSLFYKHRFDKKTEHAYEIEASVYTSLKNINSTNFENIFFDANSNELSRSPIQLEENKTTSRSANTRANYTLPFDSVYTFNTGLSANYSYNYINNISSRNNTPNLEYINLKGSFYAELGKTFKNGNAKIGTRLEVSDVIINITNSNTYVSPLPYANGQYKFSDKNSLKLNYSRRVFRPSNSQLNPFVSYVDSLTESRGNIGLKPAYRDNFQLTNTIKFGKNKFSGTISPQVFFEYRSGLIQTITKQKENSNTFEKFPENISNGYETGLNLSVYAQISTVIFNSNVRYFRIHADKYLDQINAVDKNTWSWNSQVMCPLPKDFRFFAVLSINGPTINGQELSKSTPFNLFGISKQFKNNSSLTLLAFNPFTSKNFYNTTTIDNGVLYQRSESYMDLKRMFMINYSINFKVGKDLKVQKRGEEQTPEDNGIKLPF
ncbi:MAG TPA: TonB-dependent receptor family protein, partial [Paludibacter sp.]|nr:TonB-dependent receptor family protein [Paludibacter sp.]